MAGMPSIDLKVLTNNNDIKQYYKEGWKLGEGAFGVTVKVRNVKDRTKCYAMKIQKKVNEYLQHGGGPAWVPRRLLTEIIILKKILPRHPHIVELHDIFVSPSQVFMVQELCEGGNMDNFFPVADNVSGRKAFIQLVEAVHTLHEHGVVHADIKSDNILFKDPDFTQLKLIDFGCSSYRSDLATQVHNKFDYNMWFTADDIAQSKLRAHSSLMDTLALGKILHGILSGKPPSYACSDTVYKMQTEFKPRHELFDDAAMDLLSRIGPEPFGPERAEHILTLDQIRQHPWLTGAPFQRQDEPLGQIFRELRTDLKVLPHLLKDWMVIRLTVLRNDQQLHRYYTIQGTIRRGTQDTEVLDVVDSLTQTNRMEMKVIYLTSNDKPQFAPGGFQTKPPLLLYLELLIRLRILPRHEHIVNVKTVYVTESYVAIVRELMEGRSLEEFFRLPACITKSRVIFKQLADTVRFLHLHGVVHMDLHPHHIVFKSRNETPEFSWKIVDFTQARFLPEMAHQTHEKFQPRRYLPPEMYMYDQGSTLVQIDITALGRILHAMMAGRWKPDPARCANLLPRSEIFGDAATNLLSAIGPEPFGPPPGNRNYTMDEICHHPWLQQVQME